MNPDLQKSMAFGNVAGLLPFVLVERGGEDEYGGLVECYVRMALCQPHTRSVRKVSDRIFLCEHLMDYNLARLHEPTLNLSAHA